MKKNKIVTAIVVLIFLLNKSVAQTEAKFNNGTSTTITGTNSTGNYFRIKTFDGTLDLGPQNTNWCHLNTNKDRFYFNKPIFTANGEFISYDNSNLSLKTGITGTTGSNTRLTILNSNGNVGIGTTNPSAMLHVAGSSTIDGSIKMNGIGESDLTGPALTTHSVMLLNNNQVVKTSIQSLLNLSYSAGPFDPDPSLCLGLSDPTNCSSSYTTTPTWKNIPNSGDVFVTCANVGIGISNPVHTLDVSGSSRITGNIGVGSEPKCNTKIFAYSPTSGDEFMRFDNDNGTQFKLDNGGFLTCRDIVVTLNNIPDYVFETNYKLLTIQEVEDYVTKNKHLPNVPSAAEMVANNTSVGELNMMLLEKIEELTLYIIQLEKRIADIENR